MPATQAHPRNGEGAFGAIGGGLAFVYGAFTGLGDTSRAEISIIRSSDGGESWSGPQVLFSDPKISLLHPSLIRAPDGAIVLAYSRLWDARKAVKVSRRSEDDGRTWSAEAPLSDGTCPYMTGAADRFTRVGGRLLNTVHGKSWQGAAVRLATYVFVSDNSGRTWVNSTPAGLTVDADPASKAEGGLWETSIAEPASGELLMVGRTRTGWLYACRSEDRGQTWSAPQRTAVPNPSAPAVVLRVPGTETLCLIQNVDVDLSSGWHGGPRVRLASRTSRDGGRTWTEHRTIEFTGDGTWYDYPNAMWAGDVLHLAYRRIAQSGDKRIDVVYQRLAKAWFTE